METETQNQQKMSERFRKEAEIANKKMILCENIDEEMSRMGKQIDCMSEYCNGINKRIIDLTENDIELKTKIEEYKKKKEEWTKMIHERDMMYAIETNILSERGCICSDLNAFCGPKENKCDNCIFGKKKYTQSNKYDEPLNEIMRILFI